MQQLAAEGFAAQERALAPRADIQGGRGFAGEARAAPVQRVKKDGAPGPSPNRQVFTAAPGAAPKTDGAEGASGELDSDTTRGFGAKAGQKSGPASWGPRTLKSAEGVSVRDHSGSVVNLGAAGGSQADGEESGGWGVRDGHLGYRPRAGYRPGGPVPAGGGSATVSASVGAQNMASDKFTHARRFMAAAEEHPTASEDELLSEATLDAWGRDRLTGVNKGAKTGFLGKREAAPSGLVVTKQALIIGNSDYSVPGWSKLAGAKADADNMASLYRAPPKSYQVDRRSDLRGGDLASAISSVGKDLIAGDELLIFYAGHGNPPKGDLVGVDGVEVPASVPAARAKEAQSRGFHATVILDSCYSGAVFDHFAIRGAAASKAPDATDRKSTVLDPTTNKYTAYDPAKHTTTRHWGAPAPVGAAGEEAAKKPL